MWIRIAFVSRAEVVFVALVSSTLLSCCSHSESSDVMPNRLGVFNAEEFDSNLYSVVISSEPVLAGATVDITSSSRSSSTEAEESEEESDPDSGGGGGDPESEIAGAKVRASTLLWRRSRQSLIS